ncbi:MAG: hypothetical protein ABI856_14215 [Nitrospira sp.]
MKPIQARNQMKMPLLTSTVLLGVILPVAIAHTANFDCGHIAIRAEQQICAGDELSRMDDAVAHGYQIAVGSVAPEDLSQLRESQQKWLRVRTDDYDARQQRKKEDERAYAKRQQQQRGDKKAYEKRQQRQRDDERAYENRQQLGVTEHPSTHAEKHPEYDRMDAENKKARAKESY